MVFATSVCPTKEQEYWEMVNYHRYQSNKMGGDLRAYSFTALPEGVGILMQSKTYGEGELYSSKSKN
jgi:hypothetical protein